MWLQLDGSYTPIFVYNNMDLCIDIQTIKNYCLLVYWGKRFTVSYVYTFISYDACWYLYSKMSQPVNIWKKDAWTQNCVTINYDDLLLPMV